MTEERIKEYILVGSCYETKKASLERLIENVAAEARREGIDELRDAGTRKVWDILNQKLPIARVLVLRFKEEAERLKEQGNG